MDNITTFVDSVGRVVVGQKVKSKDKKLLQIREPAVVNVQVNQQSGQISVQLLPFVFREFVKAEARERGVVWDFNRDNIVTSDNVELDDAIVKQYENIFTKPVGAATPNPQAAPEEPEVVKLFDDED